MKLTFTAFFALCIVSTEGIQTWCRVRKKGNSGELICLFKEDIGELKYNFLVERYDLINYKKTGDVVNCNWLRKGNRLECKTQPSYSFDKQVSDVIFIEIPHLNKSHEGRYVCHVLGNNDNDDTFCEYRHIETPAPEESTPSSTTSSRTKPDCTLQRDSATTDLCFSAVIPLSVLVILFFGTTIYFAGASRRTRKKRGPEAHSEHFEEIKGQLEALRQQGSTSHEQMVQRIYNESKDTQAVILKRLHKVQSSSLPQTEEGTIHYTSECELEIHDLGDDHTVYKSNRSSATQPTSTDPLLGKSF